MRTEEQNDLAAAVRSLLAKRADSEAVRAAMASDDGYDVTLWTTLCEQIGVAGLTIPEEYGGAGGSLADAAAALEEIGYSLASVPAIASLAASEALLSTPQPDTDLLTRIAGGAVATLVTGDFQLSGDQISGTAPNALYGAEAEVLLVGSADGLYAVIPTGITAEPTPAMDPNLRLATVTLMSVPARQLASDNYRDHSRIRSATLVGLSALAVGCAQRGLDMTVGYSKERVQFGRPIGSFQALKHRMADMLVLVEMARSASWAAAAGELDPGTAAAYCLDALQKVAAETIQLHGGIAITWEHDAHLIFKRAHALTQLAGQPHRLRAGVL